MIAAITGTASSDRIFIVPVCGRWQGATDYTGAHPVYALIVYSIGYFHCAICLLHFRCEDAIRLAIRWDNVFPLLLRLLDFRRFRPDASGSLVAVLWTESVRCCNILLLPWLIKAIETIGRRLPLQTHGSCSNEASRLRHKHFCSDRYVRYGRQINKHQ